ATGLPAGCRRAAVDSGADRGVRPGTSRRRHSPCRGHAQRMTHRIHSLPDRAAPMNKCLLSLLFVLAPLHAASAMAAEPAAPSLHDTFAALDYQVFDSCNRFTESVQLQKQAGYFDQAVEFYHHT